MRARRHGGFTIVEIMISIVVLALLMSFAIPSFTVFIQNSKTRVAADAMLNGLQTARNEAIRRNQCVQLKVTTQTHWEVATCADTATILQKRVSGEGTKGVSSVFTPVDSNTISFNGLGRVINPNPSDNSVPFSQVQLNNSTLSSTDDRQLRVVIPPGGSLRMCDPQVPSTDTRAC